MLSNKAIIIFLAATAISCSIFQPQTAHAENIGLGVEPPIIQIQAKPPASITTPITVENTADTPVKLSILLKAFTASDAQNGFVKYYPANTAEAKPPVFQYIQIAENGHNINTVELAPKQAKTLSMHIGLPEKIDMGDYYFSVIFISNSQDSVTKNSSTQMIGGVATNVLLSLQPTGPTNGQITEFSSPWFVEHGPVPFTLRLKNTSDHYLTPRGEILIRNMFGQLIGRVDLLPVNILAGTTRAIPDTLYSPDATPPAHFVRPQTKYEAAVWPEVFLLGPYTATLTIALSDQGPVFRRTLYFFAFPWYLSVILTIVIVSIIFIWLRVKKKMNS